MLNLFLTLVIGFTSFYTTGCAPIAVGAVGGGSVLVAHERRTTGTIVEDSAIEFKAASLLRNEPGIRESHVSVISYNGNVLLIGQVPHEAAKIRAEEILNDFTKVRRVFNELTIAAPSAYLSRAGDAYITSKVKSKIIAEKTLIANRIKVVTENGIVYLLGLVTQEEANMAIEIARHTGGVQRVVPLFERM